MFEWRNGEFAGLGNSERNICHGGFNSLSLSRQENTGCCSETGGRERGERMIKLILLLLLLPFTFAKCNYISFPFLFSVNERIKADNHGENRKGLRLFIQMSDFLTGTVWQ